MTKVHLFQRKTLKTLNLTPSTVAISEVEGRSGKMLLLLERSCNKCPVIRDFWSARRGFVKDTLGRQHQKHRYVDDGVVALDF